MSKDIKEENRRYVFSKLLGKTLASAEGIVGADALRRILAETLKDFNCGLDRLSVGVIATSLCLTDPTAVTGVKRTGEEKVIVGAGLEATPVKDALEDFVLADIRAAISTAMRNDLTGFVLQTLQQKWGRELTLKDAEGISIRLNKLIQFIK